MLDFQQTTAYRMQSVKRAPVPHHRQDYRINNNRMMSGIGIPISQSKMGMGLSLDAARCRIRVVNVIWSSAVPPKVVWLRTVPRPRPVVPVVCLMGLSPLWSAPRWGVAKR